jgi:Homing endonuclease associated repeat
MPQQGYTKRRSKWTRDEVLEAIERFVKDTGRSPSAGDFHPGDCLAAAHRSAARSMMWLERRERFYKLALPWAGTVHKLFGSWTAAVREAGYEPLKEQEQKPQLSKITSVVTAVNMIALRLRDVEVASQIDDQQTIKRELMSMAEIALAYASTIPDEVED